MHSKAERQRIVSGGTFEQLRLRLDSLQLGVGDHEVAILRGYILQCNGNQAIRIRIWKRSQKDGVDHREERSIGADSKSESQDRKGSESGVLAQHAGSEANVLPEGFHAGAWTKHSRSL